MTVVIENEGSVCKGTEINCTGGQREEMMKGKWDEREKRKQGKGRKVQRN
jgi:hypothetical protein